MTHHYTREITCPYCGHEWIDSWEAFPNEKGECKAEFRCGMCYKRFRCARNIEVTYTTWELEEVKS